jgi:hypothetical protein
MMPLTIADLQQIAANVASMIRAVAIEENALAWGAGLDHIDTAALATADKKLRGLRDLHELVSIEIAARRTSVLIENGWSGEALH